VKEALKPEVARLLGIICVADKGPLTMAVKLFELITPLASVTVTV
jgi:hypothetical protein